MSSYEFLLGARAVLEYCIFGRYEKFTQMVRFFKPVSKQTTRQTDPSLRPTTPSFIHTVDTPSTGQS